MKKGINALISEVKGIIRAYAADEEEQWVTLENGAHVLIGEGGEIEAGLGGEHDGETLNNLSAVSGDEALDYVRGRNPDFSSEEIETIENYTTDSNFVNMGLRSGNTESYNDGYQTVEIGESIATIDEAFERAEPFSEEVRLHRILIDGGSWMGDLEEGDYINDAAYTSTTTDPPYKSLGDNYISWSKEYEDESIELEIICPKGTRALYVGDISQSPEQKEVLLPRDSEFKVVGIGENDMGDKKYVVELI